VPRGARCAAIVVSRSRTVRATREGDEPRHLPSGPAGLASRRRSCPAIESRWRGASPRQVGRSAAGSRGRARHGQRVLPIADTARAIADLLREPSGATPPGGALERHLTRGDPHPRSRARRDADRRPSAGRSRLHSGPRSPRQRCSDPDGAPALAQSSVVLLCHGLARDPVPSASPAGRRPTGGRRASRSWLRSRPRERGCARR
jgi:hypothetical protein